jgi:hypothetical protein
MDAVASMYEAFGRGELSEWELEKALDQFPD